MHVIWLYGIFQISLSNLGLGTVGICITKIHFQKKDSNPFGICYTLSICIACSRLDAMNIAWGGVSGCVNPVYSCMLQLTCSLHRRGLILQNKESAGL